MMLTATIALASAATAVWGAPWLAHQAILRALRAPRMPHGAWPHASSAARTLWLPGAGGKRLFAWHLPAAGGGLAPAVVLMHGWGANAATMLPLALPLQAAGWHVVLPDARCHGRSDDDSFASLP